MNHFGVAVEYALHIMTQLARLTLNKPPSAKALAEFQGIPPAYLAKIMTSLDKAGLVQASEGKNGGYRLARPAQTITFLDIADAVEGRKSLFECTEVRQRCVLYGGKPPATVVANVCTIHAVMLAAEKRMREHLATTTVADIARPLEAKLSADIKERALRWFADYPRGRSRRSKDLKRLKAGK
jgi:Rrf2 family protein